MVLLFLLSLLMLFDINSVPTKENILSKIPQEDIFEKYLGIKPALDTPFRNPWREDINPDCRFYWDDRNPPMLKFKDFATGWNWDCFNIVQIAHKCNFGDALYIIANDFDLSKRKLDKELLKKRDIIKQLNLFQKNNAKIQVTLRKWNNADINYWKQFYIEMDMLTFYNVYPIDYAWYNDRLCYNYNHRDLGYAYYFGNDDYKLYFPLRKKGEVRFIHNNSTRLQGAKQLDPVGDILVDTKSLKDVMCLRLFGINAVAPMSETVPFPEKAYDILSKRFKNILVLKDRDRTGDRMLIHMRNKFPDVKLLRFNSDDEKDFSDNLKKHGINYMNDYIENTRSCLSLNQ